MILRIIDWYSRALLFLLTLSMWILLAAVAITVAGRYIPFVPRWFWTLEVTNFALIWMVFIGSITGVRYMKHFYIDLFPPNLPKWANIALSVVYYFVLFSATYIFIYYGYRYVIKWGIIQKSDLTGINLGFLYVSVPFAGVSWLIFLLEAIYNDITGKPKAQLDTLGKEGTV